MRTIMTIPLTLLPVQDQGGEQHAFCYELHKASWSRLIIPVISLSMRKVITFLGLTRGRVTVFFCRKLGEGIKKFPWEKKAPAFPHLPPPLINDRSLNRWFQASVAKFIKITFFFLQWPSNHLFLVCRSYYYFSLRSLKFCHLRNVLN